MLKHIAVAVMFLTRVPVGNAGSGDPEDLAASTQYFPLVGVLIGALVFVCYWLASLLWTAEIAVALAMIAAVMLTGGFHEDGLADVADSAGAWTKERKLEIMRDSRVGTYGALALILSVLLKYVTLVAIAGSFVDGLAVNGFNSAVLATLLLGHVLGRWSTLPLIRFTDYARDTAANKVFADGVTDRRLLVGSLIALLVVLVSWSLLGIVVLLATLVTCIAVVVAKLRYESSLGGVTGDCLGATNQIVEILVYLCIATVMS